MAVVLVEKVFDLVVLVKVDVVTSDRSVPETSGSAGAAPPESNSWLPITSIRGLFNALNDFISNSKAENFFVLICQIEIELGTHGKV